MKNVKPQRCGELDAKEIMELVKENGKEGSCGDNEKERLSKGATQDKE